MPFVAHWEPTGALWVPFDAIWVQFSDNARVTSQSVGHPVTFGALWVPTGPKFADNFWHNQRRHAT